MDQRDILIMAEKLLFFGVSQIFGFGESLIGFSIHMKRFQSFSFSLLCFD
jgi:hypothetical protein